MGPQPHFFHPSSWKKGGLEIFPRGNRSMGVGHEPIVLPTFSAIVLILMVTVSQKLKVLSRAISPFGKRDIVLLIQDAWVNADLVYIEDIK